MDSYVTPEPWAMPGYDSDVIMAAGAFVQGSSIELSADGPIKPPYAVYFQGGLTWAHAKLGILMSLQKLVDAGFVAAVPDLREKARSHEEMACGNHGRRRIRPDGRHRRRPESGADSDGLLERNEKPGKKLLATGNGTVQPDESDSEESLLSRSIEPGVRRTGPGPVSRRTGQLHFFPSLGILYEKPERLDLSQQRPGGLRRCRCFCWRRPA